MPNPIAQPGWFFVIATFLPLLSFAVLLLVAAVRWTLRPYARTNSGANTVFQLLGGEVTGYGPAFVALAAIALAFVCSTAGFVWFLRDNHEIHHLEAKLSHQPKSAAHAHHGKEEKEKEKKPAAKPLDEKAKKAAEEVKAATGLEALASDNP